MWRARALVLIVPLLAAVAASQMGAHPEPEAHALPVRTAQLVAATTPAPPPPPGHCADYPAMEAGRGHPTNQHWFNHLDARGYARLRAACVYGWGTAEWVCLEQLWSEESDWLPTAGGNVRGSYGIPQAYPGTKMATAGPDWRTNPRTQVRWGLDYIATRPGYGRPTRASMYRPKRPCHAGY